MILFAGVILSVNMILILISCVLIRKMIVQPLKHLAEKVEILALGDPYIQIEKTFLSRTDDIGRISFGLHNIAENMKIQSAGAKRIADGDLSIGVTPRSEQDILGNRMVSVFNVLRDLVFETKKIATAAGEGDLQFRGNPDPFQGSYLEIISGFNAMLDAAAEPLNSAVLDLQAISSGKDLTDLKNKYKGTYGMLTEDLIFMESVMDTLYDETMKLTQAAAAGMLSARADTSRLSGRYAEILNGFNESLDLLITPLHRMAGYMEKIGNGEIPEKIKEEYEGEFKDIKNSINACIDGLYASVEGQNVLYKMSMNDYSVKVKGNYRGIYNDISKSINLLNDRMHGVIEILEHLASGDLSDLERIKESSKISEKDQLVPRLIDLIETIAALYEETEVLHQAAINGNLNFRGDAKKFKGQFEKIIEGMNETLDEITAPMAETLSIMREVAEGNLGTCVTGNYKGDHGAIKTALNGTIENLLGFIYEISDTLSEICKGNLNLIITADYRGDFAIIKDSLNHIIETFGKVMGDLGYTAKQVASGSRQLSIGCQNLSQRAAEQTTTIQELTDSIAKIADQTAQNAINANKARELAASARILAENGNGQMQEMLDSMTGINDSSTNIYKIIKVIDDIAFQTNILALNAAVEASRAGQHGKGFSVVAEEVRTLAARSAAAARETTELIEDSISKVSSGTKIANDTAGALFEIVTGIGKAAELVDGIANSSHEQALNVTQVNQGIEQVFKVVRKNSDTAEKGAAASEELSGQAELLKEMVSRFEV